MKRDRKMKYAAEKVIIRQLDGFKIVFYSSRHIYLLRDHGPDTDFFRIYDPIGFYKNNWSQFRQKLLRYRTLTAGKVYQLALKHEIPGKSITEPINLDEEEVEYRN